MTSLISASRWPGRTSGSAKASGGALHFGAEALQVRIRLGRLGGCCEDRPRIALHELKPLREILRVVGPDFLRIEAPLAETLHRFPRRVLQPRRPDSRSACQNRG